MNVLIKYSLIACVASMLFACSKPERLMYDEKEARIYFSKVIRTSERFADSINYTFGVKSFDVLVDTVFLRVNLIGNAAKVDREINIIADDSSTAKRGYHYDFGKMVMPADSFSKEVYVLVYKRPGLKDSTLALYLTLGESKDFKLGYTDLPSTNYKRDRLHYKITITDQLLRPTSWKESTFGTYSKVKFQFMIVSTGKTDWNVTIFPSEENYLAQSVKGDLYAYEQANGPLIDETGARVVFP